MSGLCVYKGSDVETIETGSISAVLYIVQIIIAIGQIVKVDKVTHY
jgi:hypothetical protein